MTKPACTNLEIERLLEDLGIWVQRIESNTLQIKSALITLRQYAKEVEEK